MPVLQEFRSHVVSYIIHGKSFTQSKLGNQSQRMIWVINVEKELEKKLNDININKLIDTSTIEIYL